MTICHQWAWKPNDEMKSLKQCLQTLVTCVGGDGNLLFNVGPMPTGEIEPRQVERLKQMGAWLDKYGESVYGTHGGPYKPSRLFASTRKDNVVYVHILDWNGDSVTLPALPKKIVASSLLTGGKVEVKQTEAGLTIAVAPADRQEIDTIVKLQLDGSAMDIAPLAAASTIKAKASNVFQNEEEYSADKAFDNDSGTRWATDGGTKTAWIEFDLGKPKSVSSVSVQEALGTRVQKFEVQYQDGGQWKPIFAGTTLGPKFVKKFKPVTAQHIRLNILDATEGPTISEIVIGEGK
jgi:alpha-L-fucosidase